MRGRRTATRHAAALLALAIAVAPAAAQDLQDRAVPPPADGAGAPAADSDDQVSFSANALDYDDQNDIVTATGDVRMLRAGSRLRADKVVWNRKTGVVHASGNVAGINPGGDTVYGDEVDLQDDLKNGVVENALLVLGDGGRLSARKATRAGEIETLDHAAYTPCSVTSQDCRPHEPSWKITALRIVHDGDRHRIYYKDARFSLFGHTVLALPAFSHPDGSNDEGGGSGTLMPNLQYSKATGAEFALPYYFQLAPNRDLTLTPHLYTGVLPAIEGEYRALDTHGAFQVRAMGTYGSRLPAQVDATGLDSDKGLRGFIDANGRYQLSPEWSVSGQLRAESDRTFMRRYGISNDDRLRSNLAVERIDDKSYLSIGGWFTQTLRAGDVQGQQPIALPAIDYRRRIADPLFGGLIQLQANTLALTRTDGQDTQRAFVGARWDLRRLTPLGQEITLTAYTRADAYHTDNAASTITQVYRGTEGWQYRGIAALALDVRWPLIGAFAGGTQQLVPRIQFVASPQLKNLAIPDEDSRAVDLEDTNLFSLNRFSGYDRWEDGSRMTYGAEWNFDRAKWQVRAVAGQSYRLTDEPTILPKGTGLSDRFSDFVGRITIKYGSFVELTERFRIDKDNGKLRRNEIDATVGSRSTYVLIGYLKLDRNVDLAIEDLRDREEIRLGGRIKLARYWSLYGSAVIDLTSKGEDPTALGDGFQPVRNRVGVVYENECLSLGVTWLRDYNPIGDARRGSTFSLRLALKNLGR